MHLRKIEDRNQHVNDFSEVAKLDWEEIFLFDPLFNFYKAILRNIFCKMIFTNNKLITNKLKCNVSFWIPFNPLGSTLINIFFLWNYFFYEQCNLLYNYTISGPYCLS